MCVEFERQIDGVEDIIDEPLIEDDVISSGFNAANSEINIFVNRFIVF